MKIHENSTWPATPAALYLLSLSVPLLWSINGRFLQPQVCFCVMNLNDPLCRRNPPPAASPQVAQSVFLGIFFAAVVVVVLASRLPASTGGGLSQCGRQAGSPRALAQLTRCDNTCRQKIFNNLANDFSLSGSSRDGRGRDRD